ncbi:GNAT family N-acetyltransferase [Candidatus Chloroploca sp. Khr17]|uniref:GNAT family N-acetyltransferase n=1 Tax=Candidatus Chloroploca sp. Khr17 TaxID=2496869 RepID=UPI00101DF7C4|nr:GNAT family N-acetyltransferase [Candidatus Chloroploca sp. Khr17]
MRDTHYRIRTMTRDELDLAIEWAAQEGWNPGWYDAHCYYAADPTGFLVGLLGDTPVATLSVVRYGASFGFLGFYLVHPQHRGKGYGLQLWKAGLNYLEGRNIGLDGVVAQQENYQKSGFTLAYRNLRFAGRGGGAASGSAAIVPLSSLPFAVVSAYSKAFFPADRSGFLKEWINQPHSYAYGILDDHRLAGYGVLRSCRTGYKIGPLFANNSALAEVLFLELKAKVDPAEPIFLDVPEINANAVALAARAHMTVAFETARMYNHQVPDINAAQTYGITSFEVG